MGSVIPLASLAALALVALLAASMSGGCASEPVREDVRERERKGLELLRQGREQEAAVELEEAVRLDPGAYQAVMALATVRSRQGRRLDALALMERLVAEEPTLAVARMSLGDLYSAFGMDEQALAEYQAVSGIWNDAFGPAFLGMATIHERRGQDAQAARALVSAINLLPANPEPYYRLAELYERRAIGAAPRAWAGYLAVALDNGREDPLRIARARERVKAHGAAGLDAATAGEVLRALRREVTPRRVHAADDVGPTAAGAAVLERPFYGRLLVRIHIAGPKAPVAGSGRGATLAEAVRAAAADLQRAAVFETDVSRRLDQARIEIALEAGEERAIDLTPAALLGLGGAAAGGAGDAGGPPAARGAAGDPAPFRPGVDGLELRLRDGRATVLLPSDQAREGIEDGDALLGALARRLATAPEDLVGVRALVFAVVGFVEPAAGGGGEPLPVEAGLIPVRAQPAGEALARARAAATRLRDSLGARGRFHPGHDPIRGAVLGAPVDAAAHARIAAALAVAGERLGEPRLRDTASAALGMLEPLFVARGDGLRVVVVEPEGGVAPAAAAAGTAEEGGVAGGGASTGAAAGGGSGAAGRLADQPTDVLATAEASLLAESLGRRALALDLARGLAAALARRGDLDGATAGRVALALARAGRAASDDALEAQAALLVEDALASAARAAEASAAARTPDGEAGAAAAGGADAAASGLAGLRLGGPGARGADAARVAADRGLLSAPAIPALVVLFGGPADGRARAAGAEALPALFAAADRAPAALEVLEALAGVAALGRRELPEGFAPRAEACLRASATLGYTRSGAFLFPGQEDELTGLFRRSALDPRAFALDAARRLEAILALGGVAGG